MKDNAVGTRKEKTQYSPLISLSSTAEFIETIESRDKTDSYFLRSHVGIHEWNIVVVLFTVHMSKQTYFK